MNPNTVERVLATYSGSTSYGQIYFARFDKVVELESDDTQSNYGRRCIENFFNWQETLFIALQNATFAFYRHYKEEAFDDSCVDLEILAPQEIWHYCEPTYMHIDSSANDPDSTFIDIQLNCAWESHHMQWLVKNTDEVMYVGPYYGHAGTNEKLSFAEGNYAAD